VSNQRGLPVLSLFTGAGGLDVGFHLEGFDVLACVEIEPQFCRTIERNKPGYFNPDAEVICADIRDLDPHRFRQLPIEFVIGGPPCQTFSAAGRRAGGAPGTLDRRGTLFEAYCRIISTVKPKGFLFENVRGILGSNRGEDWRHVSQAFRSLGYNLAYRILDACDYGIPQHRERLILVGHQNPDFWFPRPTHGPDSPHATPWLTPRQAFKGLPTQPDDGHFATGKYSHLVTQLPPGENYLYFTAMRGHPNPVFAYRSRFSDFLYKAHPDRPTKTMIANPGKYSGPFHWESRRFTIPEYKRLQGFPDDYQFEGTYADQVRQIGNSVSPLFARSLARAVARQLFSADVDVDLIPLTQGLSFDSRKGREAQRTRAKHAALANSNQQNHAFHLRPYSVTWSNNGRSRQHFASPDHALKAGQPQYFQAICSIHESSVALDVTACGTAPVPSNVLAECVMSIRQSASDVQAHDDITLHARLFTATPAHIQALWDAIDEFVIESSSFHSLFEIYGHFTEPHPVFRIDSFRTFAYHPVLTFAEHASNFANCSQFFPLQRLNDIFGRDHQDALEIIDELRSYRYDIRCHETNIAIPKGYYMLAYPFTLPSRKQMNFRIKRNNAAS